MTAQMDTVCYFCANGKSQKRNSNFVDAHLWSFILYELCDKVLFRMCTSLSDSWDKHTVLPQTETIPILHHAKPQIILIYMYR